MYFVTDKGIFEVDKEALASDDSSRHVKAVKELKLPKVLSENLSTHKLVSVERFGNLYHCFVTD